MFGLPGFGEWGRCLGYTTQLHDPEFGVWVRLKHAIQPLFAGWVERVKAP